MEKPGLTRVPADGNQFLFHKLHPSCYSYIQSSPVKSLGSGRGKKTSKLKVKDPLSFEIVNKLPTYWQFLLRFISI